MDLTLKHVCMNRAVIFPESKSKKQTSFFSSTNSGFFLLKPTDSANFSVCKKQTKKRKKERKISVMASNSVESKSLSDNFHDQELVNGDLTVLQKHFAFFDKNKDGIVYPWETYLGCRAIGCGIPLSTVSAFLINATLSQTTRPGKFPSPLFPIEIKNIQRSKHGSDSGVYDMEGRFVPSKFEEIFSKHAHTNSNALTSEELSAMLKANRIPKDYGGWVGSWTEWKLLYFLCRDENGFLHKDTIKAVYDGSLFERLEKERAAAQKAA